MPDHHTVAVTGKVAHVFGHRFVVETDQGVMLADLTPRGAEQHALRIGEVVSLSGEMKPSELKVSQLTVGKTTILIEHKKPHDHHPHAEPGDAMKAARDVGFEREPDLVLADRGAARLHLDVPSPSIAQ